MGNEDISKIRLIFELSCLFIYALVIQLRNIFRIGFPGAPVKLEGQIILVTGGASGLGRAICRQLVDREKNLTLVIWDTDEKETLDTVLELRSIGLRNAFAFKVDVSDREQVAGAAKTVREEIGDISILFNNTGISGNLKPGWLEDPQMTETVLATNVTSHCWTLREFLPKMIEKGRGHVVETCSLLGFLTYPSSSAFAASKFAIRGYIESIKQDVRIFPSKPNICFSMVYPNHTFTTPIENTDFRKLRYKFLFTRRSPSFVADKIVDGMLHRKEHIFMSVMDRVLIFIINTFPTEAANKLMDFAGLTSLQMELMR